jgi:phytoene desaturase
MSKEVIIIGAGPGGLAAAILLAGAGVGVKVFERTGNVGGRTSRLELGDYRFDFGPTFFLYPRVLEVIFSTVGAQLRDEVDLVRLDPQYRIVFGAGGRIDATRHIAEMERQIGRISPADAPGFARFMRENREKMAAMEPCLEMPYGSWRDVLTSRLFKLLPMLRPHQNLDAYLKRFFADERVRLAFCFQSKYLGMSPFRCPSLFSILSFLEYEHGVFHPMGGCAEVTQAMARVAERSGVEILLDTAVEEVLFRGRRAVGVRTATKTFPADAVVMPKRPPAAARARCGRSSRPGSRAPRRNSLTR